MQEEEIELLITRYLSLKTTTEENEKLTEWISLAEENEQEFQRIKMIWSGERVSLTQPELAKAFNLISEKLAAAGEPIRRERTPSRHKSVIRWFYYPVAASLVFGAALFLFSRKQGDEPWKIVRTAAGEKTEIHLPDGTSVWLAPNSELSYPEGFSRKDRRAILKGEAFFSVASDPARPFSVRSGLLVTDVLGTKFNVNARDSMAIRVSLTEGKVNVRPDQHRDQHYLLKPGEQLVYRIPEGKGQLRTFDEQADLGWRNNTLAFRDELLPEALPKIEAMYGVKLVPEGEELQHIRLWGTFNNEPLDSVLTFMKTGNGIQYRKQGNLIYLNLAKKGRKQ